MNLAFYNKYTFLFILIHFFVLINTTYQKDQGKSNNFKIKRIILTLFPGISSHNLVVQNLLDYTISNENEFKYEYYIISHKTDSKIWENKIKSDNNSYKLYTYGDFILYDETINSAIEEMNNNPTFGFFGFNKAMILNIKQFMDSDIFSKLKKLQFDYKKKYNEDYFHMIATDIPNFIHKLLYLELNIKLNIYIQPSPLFQIYYPNFEFNTAYTPIIGSIYSDQMTFIQRLKNSFAFTYTKILFKIFKMYQTQIINSYGYDIDNNIYIYDSFHIIQYPLGLCFPFSIPPNFALIGSVTSQKTQKINDINIEKILNKYNRNIYINIENKINDIIDIFKELEKENIGIIISIEKDEIIDKEIKDFPKNVYISKSLERNNILGDKRINLFITDGEFNSIQESIYHEKPIIDLGIHFEHFNVDTFIKDKKIGEVFQNRELINRDNIISLIKKVLNNDEYKINVKKIGEIIRNMKNPKEEFKYWIDYGFKFGYNHLQIESYKYKYSWIIINGYDIAFVWIIIFIIIIYIIKRIYNCLHDCLCGKCENKHKIRNKRNHYKFD